MPPARRVTRLASTSASPLKASGSGSNLNLKIKQQKLRRVTPEELDDWWSGSESEEDATALPQQVDDAWPYMFQPGDNVWIRTAGGNWHRGRVSAQMTRKGITRQRTEGFFYSVVFNDKLRKYFAPLNGDIKPDNRHTRELLEGAGVL